MSDERDRNRLRAAAHRARLDGFLPWEVPEIVMAEARAVGIPCSPATARRIVTGVCGPQPWTGD